MDELPPLPIETVIVLRELASGRVLAQPVAGPGFAAYENEDDALVGT